MQIKKKKERKHIKILPRGINLKLFYTFKRATGVNLNRPAVNIFNFTKSKVLLNRINRQIWKKEKIETIKFGVEKKTVFRILKRIRNYKYWRHRAKLPVRGQRTHTNCATQKKFKRLWEKRHKIFK